MKLIIYVNCNDSEDLAKLDAWLTEKYPSLDNIPEIDFKLEGSTENVMIKPGVLSTRIYVAVILESLWQFEALMSMKIKNVG